MRIKQLDVLRCIAVLLVLVAHSELPWRITGSGYIGVDLFFVLSGFLISGLLFDEYKKRSAINFWRFFIRRSLKIYPSFYLLILATFIYQARYHQLASLRRYVGEIFYVQNYTLGLWGHEWSLAVEEHFYIVLPVVLLLLMRWSSRRANPFQAIPWMFVAVATICLAFRTGLASRFSTAELQLWRNYDSIYNPTQCRMDGLFFGVLLGYVQHFRLDILSRLLARRSIVVFAAILSVMLLSPALFLPQRNKLMVTAGLTAVYLGFGIILMLSLHVRGILPRIVAQPCARIGNICASVGVYSYSIYLWHWPIRSWAFALTQKLLHIQLGPLSGFVVFASASISFGILMSRLVEYPILKVRDHIFPSAAQASRPITQNETDAQLVTR